VSTKERQYHASKLLSDINKAHAGASSSPETPKTFFMWIKEKNERKNVSATATNSEQQ
jgi:hypothetical protein